MDWILGGRTLTDDDLTKREYFAIMIMQAIISNDHGSAEFSAKRAVKLADALIKTLENNLPNTLEN